MSIKRYVMPASTKSHLLKLLTAFQDLAIDDPFTAERLLEHGEHGFDRFRELVSLERDAAGNYHTVSGNLDADTVDEVADSLVLAMLQAMNACNRDLTEDDAIVAARSVPQ